MLQIFCLKEHYDPVYNMYLYTLQQSSIILNSYLLTLFVLSFLIKSKKSDKAVKKNIYNKNALGQLCILLKC